MGTALFVIGIVVMFFGSISFIVPNVDAIRGPAFFISWLVTELAAQFLVINIIVLAVLFSLGGYRSIFGMVGTILILLNCAILVFHIVNSTKAKSILKEGLVNGLTIDDEKGFNRETIEEEFEKNCASIKNGLIFPFPIKPSKVKRVKNISYVDDNLRRHKLDIYTVNNEQSSTKEDSKESDSLDLNATDTTNSNTDGQDLTDVDLPLAADNPTQLKPVVMVVHGGAWVIGQKENQGLPHIHTLVNHGYVCVAINYRLSPKATWPDHITDVKSALVWVKENIANFGGDKDNIALLGMSAGGHLVSLAALSMNDPQYQTGFEDKDTSFKACVPIYPVLDLTNSLKVQSRQLISMLSRFVFKTSLRSDNQNWENASPLFRNMENAPPMFILHGSKDLLVPIQESIEFVNRYRQNNNIVCFANLTGAQHAFEIFWSYRARKSVAAVLTFLNFMCKECL